MPRSSRTKSRKHSSREVRDYSDSEEDLKRNGKEEGSVRVSKDSMSGDKRKVAVKDLVGHGNGVDVADEVLVVSKRRKDKAEGGGGSDRWNADAPNDVFVDVKIETFNSKAKEKEKVLVDSSRSKTGRRHESDKKDELLTVVAEEESKSGRVESKRKGDKEYGRKEYKEKERWDKEKLLEDGKDAEFTRKHGLHSVDVAEERHGKRSRENIEGPVQDQLRNPELEKELDKRIRRRVDGSSDKDKYQDDARDYDEKRSSKGDRSKDVWSKDERHGDKYNEENEKYSRHKEDKYREDSKDSRYKDAKYREEGEKDNRYRDAKYREDSDRDNTNCDDNYREDGDRDKRHKDEKYREDGERNIRHREDKYHEDGVKDDRHRDDRYREDVNKDSRHKEEKHRENADRDRDGKRRDVKHRNDSDRDKRSRDVKYRDDHSSRDRISDSEKRLRDENNASDHHYRKSSNRDGSPTYDERGSRYKDDRGNRKATDKEDHNDIRSQSTKEQQFDAEKRSGSNKVDLITDRGRSNFRNADADVTLNHSRRRSSPSSSTHGARDHYRVSKLEESKYRDYGYDDRTRQNGSSGREFNGAKQNEKLLSSRLMEKSIQKDDSQFNESSVADRRLRSDARASPLRMVDKSPSSTSNDRRHLNRTDVRRSIEKEESGQRSGGSRDYTGREGKGGRELPMHTHAVDEYSQADGDKSSASSPFTRNFSGNSRSILPPPPFRTGVDSPSGFGPGEDDNRGRFNNRHRRGGDSNMGRSQGNAWKGIPNWPSPVTNGYMPFPHGPPPVGFHAVMQQFPSPPIFGVRPTMDMNHSLPYHMSDADRFPGHGRQLGWRNSVDDSAPSVHGWDANNSVFGDDNRGYGRVDWDQNRTQMGNRGWDTSGDMWKGSNSGLNTELTSAPQKEDLKHSAVDDVLAGQQAQIEQNQPNGKADSLDVQSIDALPNVTLNPSEKPPLKSRENSKMSTKDDVYDHNVYLSRLDISTDLTKPELYDQLTSLMDFDSNTLAFEDDVKILYVEDGLEAKVSDQIMSSAMNNTVFQKAMSLYEKQKGETEAAKGERAQTPSSEYLKIQGLYNEKAALTDGNSRALVPFCVEQGREDAVSDHKEQDLPRDAEESQPACKKLDETFLTDNMVGSEGEVRMGNVTEMEVDPGSRQENVSTPLLNVEPSSPLLPSNLEEMPPGSPVVSHSADDEHRLTETKCATMLLSDVSAEAMMPESVESGSVYLSRIHHSPESTH
ncbi:uncharacterized protein LOC108202519 isoform X1 [Daucus carota subsp. sativus]|uniref:uncharacterized protein LOC108202519 isoform X1 n=1 Tax=Daucus carota subsp. sativus TaxID=79200 RepID=UPI0007EEFA4C|nr:PREDICTED: filaggrin isoform X1 [Daucus carota subsp. sativus]